MNLYELVGARLDLQHKLQELNLDEQTILDTLEGDSAELEAKIENYGWVIKSMESFVGAMKVEENRMTERRKKQEKKVEYIKEWLLTNMQACGITKIECPAFTLSVKQNPPKVVIDNEGLIPNEYYREVTIEPTWSLEKKVVSDAIKSGIEVPGAHLETGYRIDIK